MTDPQTEARAIAQRLERAVKRAEEYAGMMPARQAVKIHPNDWHAVCDLAREAATALAAKDAELAEVRQQYVDANEARIDAEAQLAEANKALEPFAAVAEHDIGDDETDDDIFWPISNARYSMSGRLRVGHLRAARQALASSGGRT